MTDEELIRRRDAMSLYAPNNIFSAAQRKRIAALPAVTVPDPYIRTGVKDRDGREICVGDRIRIDLSGPNTKPEYWHPEYEIVFNAPYFTIKHVGGDKDSDTARFYWNVPQRSSTEKITTISAATAPLDAPKHLTDALDAALKDYTPGIDRAVRFVSIDQVDMLAEFYLNQRKDRG